MCGIFGYFDQSKKDVDLEIIRDMGNVIKYRGPDGQGIYSKPGLALGNQRLAILDIENGQQPFISDDGQIVVVQNGEIFNHIELANELKDSEYYCRTHCDTEVILRLYEKFGIEFVSKLNGMFAIAIWDNRTEELYLIRDRVGEKPLYYYYNNSTLIFASEIKSIFSFDVKKEINFNAIDSFLTFNYVTPPLTMFQHIEHVMPGMYLKISASSITDVKWWDISKIEVKTKSENDWIAEFNETLDDSVKIRLRADVPFGAFLSGGVDSSTVVGLMAKHMRQPVKTFSIGFHDPLFDESSFAKEAAERFSTEHVMEKVESNLLSLWSMVTYHCDQPHGDVSFMPTFRVAQLAAQKVKMVLTGDGADELFAGYDKYKNFFSQENIDSLDDDAFRKKYKENISLFNDDDKDVLYSREFKASHNRVHSENLLNRIFDDVPHMDRINQALYIDTVLLLSGNNLVKPDRMGMAVSIENRAPFLDYRMIELAFSMPGNIKLKDGETKYIYKKAVSGLIGETLAYRKKQMFTVPIGEWLKNELKDMVLDLLLSNKAKSRGLFNYDTVYNLYSDHCNNIKNNTREIRALMALEIWYRIFFDAPAD